MSPKEHDEDQGAIPWRVGELEDDMKDMKARTGVLEHWRTFLLGAWLIIASVGGWVVTTANSSVASELIQLRRELAVQRGVKVP